MIISFAYSIDEMVFYADGYLIQHGRIEAVQYFPPHANYFINGDWRNERHVSDQHKYLIQKLINYFR